LAAYGIDSLLSDHNGLGFRGGISENDLPFILPQSWGPEGKNFRKGKAPAGNRPGGGFSANERPLLLPPVER
jgi:hypothetical protein